MALLAVDIIKALEELEPPVRKVFIKILEKLEKSIGDTVKREDFLELKNIVSDLTKAQKETQEEIKKLTEAQKKTEEKVNALAEEVKALAQEVKSLAEAQKKTEEKVNELAEEVKELAQAQKKTEEKVNELAEAQKKTEEKVNALAQELKELAQEVKELAQAQKKTEEKVNELAEAQKKTEEKLNKLVEAQKKTEEELRKLAEEHRKTREDLHQLRKEFGGFTRTFSYAFENEAYRNLPKVLKEKYGIEVTERFIRTEIEGEEINFLAKGRVNGKEVVLVGEAKLRFDEGKRDFDRALKEIEKKEIAVRKVYRDKEVVKLIVTHYAKPIALKMAEERGIIVVQSFEW
ncbi:hypothetical protein THC_1654 [Caldimicrobium thiodismutans]|uniref:Chordopoxvirus fusion protein n=1 Tax=Caldimicrobium thiodismutans TaxID=1653476 RepID=A0A0U5AZ89_9BACT|nr:hypothetical protein [Caldimicrobium thiodismutans]BAU24014.1 hypothetical protein THC_1654 [Caldimicrobium thiodismutans]